jgi:hypothetical protein
VSDPYEHGFEVAQRRRLDLPPEPEPERHSRWQRPGRVGWQVLVVLLGIVVLVAIGRAMTARNATNLRADCTHMRLAVAEDSVVSRGSSLLHWAATAPSGTRFVVAIDPAGSARHAQVTPAQSMGGGCLARGEFGVLVPPGDYDVTLLRLDGDTETKMATRSVSVTGS